MFDDALAHFKGQIEAGKARVTALEPFDNAQGVKIMIEPIAEASHLAIQLVLTSMSTRRMAIFRAEAQDYRKLYIQIQSRRYSAGDLRDFDGVGKAIVKMIRD